MNTKETSDTCSNYFVEKSDWMENGNIGRMGLISCPKKACSIKIGTYSYSGLKCRCGQVVRPGFLIYHDRVQQ